MINETGSAPVIESESRPGCYKKRRKRKRNLRERNLCIRLYYCTGTAIDTPEKIKRKEPRKSTQTAKHSQVHIYASQVHRHTYIN